MTRQRRSRRVAAGARHHSSAADAEEIRAQSVARAIGPPPDVPALRRLALRVPDGLLRAGFRCTAWLALCGHTSFAGEATSYPLRERLAPREASAEWFDQVQKDTHRALYAWVPDPSAREERRHALTRLIARVLIRDASLHYFQGFHDIASVVLLVAGEVGAYTVLCALADGPMRPLFGETLAPVVSVLDLLFPAVRHADAELAAFLAESGAPPLFALSWVLTWFAHNVDDLPAVERLFDAFLAGHTLLPLYVSAALVLRCRDAVLALPCDSSAVHGLFTRNLPQPFDVALANLLVSDAIALFERLPPDSLLGGVPRGPNERGNRDALLKRANAVAVAVVASGLTAGAVLIGVLLPHVGAL